MNTFTQHFKRTNKILSERADVRKPFLPIYKQFSIRFFNTSRSITGWDKLDAFEKTLEDIQSVKDEAGNYRYKLFPYQKDFVKHFLHASIDKIFTEEEMRLQMPDIEKRLGRIATEHFVLLTARRQVGKTHTLAVFNAAMAMAIPSVKICVFATGQTASGRVLEKVKEIIINTYGAGLLGTKSLMKVVYIKGKWGSYSIITAHSSKEEIGVSVCQR